MPLQFSQRQLKVGELLRHKIAEILSKGNIHDQNLSNYTITVTQVIISPDLRWGKVYVTFLGEKQCDHIVETLNNYAYKVQKQIAIHSRLKRTPKLRFFLDNSFDNAEKINKSLISIPSHKRI